MLGDVAALPVPDSESATSNERGASVTTTDNKHLPTTIVTSLQLQWQSHLLNMSTYHPPAFVTWSNTIHKQEAKGIW